MFHPYPIIKISESVTHITILLTCLSLVISCKPKSDYISYYQKVNEIDSIYRLANEPEKAIRQYRKLFRKYAPKNQERIEEYETYIMLSDKFNKKFGGKTALKKLIHLLAPYGEAYKTHTSLYHKYGIDSASFNGEYRKWKKNRNKVLVDSFTVAFIRDQEKDRTDQLLQEKNDKKNAELLKWTFQNYGYPSLQKIGLIGNNDVFMPMDNFLLHMIGSQHFNFFKEELLKYIKTGDCPPRNYSAMVDRQNQIIAKKKAEYGNYILYDTVLDTVFVNKNRKSIGLPSLQHAAAIKKDFFKKQ